MSLVIHQPKLSLWSLELKMEHNAMYDEYNALIKNDTWVLVPRPSGANIVWFLWLFQHKFHADGSLSRYKARLVANGSSQQIDIDCDETFSPIVKPVTIRTVLSLALIRHWPIHPLDVKNAFLNGDLSETVYMHQPLGFVDPWYPHHKRYAMGLLERAHMLNCNLTRTLVDTESKLGLERTPISDPTLYRSLAAPLNCSQKDLRYVRGTLEFGLQLYASLESSLVADWPGCPATRRSTSRYCVFLGINILSWSSKRQPTLSCSSAEAEYRGVANVVAETTWLRNLLRELHTPFLTATLVYCDNVSAVYLSSNPMQHQQTKHIEIDIHFVRDMVAIGHVRVLHIPSRYQYADIFTKGLLSTLFEEFRTSLTVRLPPAQTAKEC
nr:ribonuclease H-like domain-containing protein [Tanacetum cinerariifolium]